MAPLLIDSRDVLKLVFISALAVVLVFASGFFIGHQRAAVFYQAGSEVQSLTLPVRVANAGIAIDSQLPDKVVAGEEIDVDQPETIISEIILKGNHQTSAKPLEKKKVPELYKSNDKKTAEIKVEQKMVEHKKESLADENKNPGLVNSQIETVISSNDKMVKQHGGSSDALIVTTFTSDELSRIKYSIQVGMYGSLVNAENMMKMLQTQKYDAYITDYTNKKNETRYNVRYGYFANKNSAIVSLEKFKSDKKGDGYLVRFSAENIVNIADVAVINQPVNVPAHNEESGNEVAPVAIPPDITHDKISQADVLNDSLIKTN